VTGYVPYEEAPGYFKGAFACILPFQINKFTRYSNPYKLYDYLATGLPIVSTHLPEAQQFSETIHISGTKEEFLNNIFSILRGESKVRRLDPKTYDWSARIPSLLAALDGTAEKKHER
jgi:hypothetical protein